MASLDWLEQVKAKFGSSIVAVRDSAPGEPEIQVSSAQAHELLNVLKNLEGGSFDHLADLTSYDRHPEKPRFFVVYELISMLRKQRCSVIVACDGGDKPTIPTVSDLWKGANWLEREVYDLMGIEFSGHPDMRRILLPEAFKGSPLRKDFSVDYRQQFPAAAEESGLFDPFGHSIVKEGKR